MNTEIIKLIGQEAGPVSMILAGVHGNESCGLEALNNLLPSLTIARGTVVIVYGNPAAIEQGVRFEGSDLNRMFKPFEQLSGADRVSYEYERAQFLKEYLNQSEALLDLHASLTPDSQPFIICEAQAGGIARYLPADLVISGFDSLEPGGADYYMNSLGKIGICLECGYNEDPQSILVAEEAILAFLSARGHIAGNNVVRRQSYIKMLDIYKTRTDSFIISKPFADFEEVRLGQLIGVDGDREVRAERDALILFARNRQQAGSEAFLLGVKKNSLT